MADPSSNAASPIRVRLFAALREQAGWAERDWPSQQAAIPPGSRTASPQTPRAIWMALALDGSFDSVRTAVNQHFADPDTVLQPGDELAFLPPISGG
ncbi:MAG: MoaD/ThiS family protein [Cyanobacteria bacterium K_DeepCast_35m_m2_023]|nr:MoaD/ThiS family protein [Cyanobacteria bacterium K_DeepCast_35m_m2_023]